MDPLIGSSLITSGGSLVNSVANGIIQDNINEDNRNHDRKIFDLQSARDNALVMSQRKYDSPAEQKRRLMQAGYNSATALDKIANDTGIKGQTPQAHATPAQVPQFGIDLSSLQSAVAQLEQNKFTSKENKLSADLAREQLTRQLLSNRELAEMDIQFKKLAQLETFKHEIEKMKLGHTQTKEIQSAQFSFQSRENSLDRAFKRSESALERAFRFRFQEAQNQFAKSLADQTVSWDKQKYYNDYYRSVYESNRNFNYQMNQDNTQRQDNWIRYGIDTFFNRKDRWRDENHWNMSFIHPFKRLR